MRERVALYGGRFERARRPRVPRERADPAAFDPEPRRPDERATAAIRVILVDDQALVRTGFRMILEDEPDIEVVGEAAERREAGVEAAERPRPTSS